MVEGRAFILIKENSHHAVKSLEQNVPVHTFAWIHHQLLMFTLSQALEFVLDDQSSSYVASVIIIMKFWRVNRAAVLITTGKPENRGSRKVPVQMIFNSVIIRSSRIVLSCECLRKRGNHSRLRWRERGIRFNLDRAMLCRTSSHADDNFLEIYLHVCTVQSGFDLNTNVSFNLIFLHVNSRAVCSVWVQRGSFINKHTSNLVQSTHTYTTPAKAVTPRS